MKAPTRISWGLINLKLLRYVLVFLLGMILVAAYDVCCYSTR